MGFLKCSSESIPGLWILLVCVEKQTFQKIILEEDTRPLLFHHGTTSVLPLKLPQLKTGARGKSGP